MKNEIIKQHKATSNKKRQLCIVLALLMIFGTIIPIIPAMTVSAAEVDTEKQSRIAEVKEILDAVPYIEYLKAKSDLYFEEHGQMPMGSDKPIVITPANRISDPELTTAQGVAVSEQTGWDASERKDVSKSAVYLPDKGTV